MSALYRALSLLCFCLILLLARPGSADPNPSQARDCPTASSCATPHAPQCVVPEIALPTEAQAWAVSNPSDKWRNSLSLILELFPYHEPLCDLQALNNIARLKEIKSALSNSNFQYHLNFLIATLPGEQFGRTNYLETIFKGAAELGYMRESAYYPWEEKRTEQPSLAEKWKVSPRVSEEADHQPDQPGILILSRHYDPESENRSERELLIIYLLPEDPVSGISEQSFKLSIRDISILIGIGHHMSEYPASRSIIPPSDYHRLKFLGPVFSSSRYSLANIIPYAHSLDYSLRMVTGRASSPNNAEFLNGIFMDIGNKCKNNAHKDQPAIHRLNYQSVIPSSKQQIRAMIKFLKDHDRELESSQKDEKQPQIALLVESSSSWGQDLIHELSDPDNPAANTVDGVNILLLPYRLNLGTSLGLQVGQRSPGGGGKTAVQRGVALDDELPREPAPLSLSGAQAETLALDALLKTIAIEQIWYVGIASLSAEDRLFLTKAVQRLVSGVQIFTMEADLTDTLPERIPVTRGILTVSSYPLLSKTQLWTPPYRGHIRRLHFARSRDVGVYNAFIRLMDQGNQHRIDDGMPLTTDSGRPVAWISQITGEGIIPLDAIDPSTLPPSTQGQPSQDRQKQEKAGNETNAPGEQSSASPDKQTKPEPEQKPEQFRNAHHQIGHTGAFDVLLLLLLFFIGMTVLSYWMHRFRPDFANKGFFIFFGTFSLPPMHDAEKYADGQLLRKFYRITFFAPMAIGLSLMWSISTRLTVNGYKTNTGGVYLLLLTAMDLATIGLIIAVTWICFDILIYGRRYENIDEIKNGIKKDIDTLREEYKRSPPWGIGDIRYKKASGHRRLMLYRNEIRRLLEIEEETKEISDNEKEKFINAASAEQSKDERCKNLDEAMKKEDIQARTEKKISIEAMARVARNNRSTTPYTLAGTIGTVCILVFLAQLAVFGASSTFWRDINHKKLFFLERASNLNYGSSILIPVMFLLILIILRSSLSRFLFRWRENLSQDFGTPDKGDPLHLEEIMHSASSIIGPDLSQASQDVSNSAKKRKSVLRAQTETVKPDRRNVYREMYCRAGLFMATTAILGAFTFAELSIYETGFWRLIVGIGFSVAIATIVLEFWRFVSVAVRFQRSLRDMATGPLLHAFSRMPVPFARQLGIQITDAFEKSIEREIIKRHWQLLVKMYSRIKEKKIVSESGGGLLFPGQELDIGKGIQSEDTKKLKEGLDDTIQDKSNKSHYVEGVGLLFRYLQYIEKERPLHGHVSPRNNGKDKGEEGDLSLDFEKMRTVPTETVLTQGVPDSLHVWLRLAEDVVAIQRVIFIHRVFALLRAELVYVTLGMILLLLAFNLYPFQPYRLMMAALWSILLVVLPVTLWVFVRMDRDQVLSAIAHTKPGQVTLSGDFISRLVTYIVLPFVTFLVAQEPNLRALFLAWIEPALRSLR